MNYPALDVQNIVKAYNGINVVDNVSFSVMRGEIVALVGPNGSGKTTLVECIINLRRADSGLVRLDGLVLDNHWTRSRFFGVQLQEAGLPSSIRAREAVHAVAVTRGAEDEVDDVLARLQIKTMSQAQFGKLSGGQKRRVQIASAIVGKPPLIILDEPTSGIDVEGRGVIWRLLKEIARSGVGVLVTTHDLSEAEDYADRIVALVEGRLVLYGKVNEIIGKVGAWRMRVLNPDESIRHYLSSSPRSLRSAPYGNGLVIVGERDAVEATYSKVKELNPNSDALVGPIRLEDLYAVVTHTSLKEPG